MATGHAYDSESGRAIAAAITSLMTGTAYRRSAELAAAVGPYDGYARNAKPHQRVIRMHADASGKIRAIGPMDRDILDLASETWQECVQLGDTSGYRNAQASLLAPTGTIGLMMDCDTTGIEPDLALVKFKKLVGGGSMQIVNQTVPRALKNLGYPHEQVEAITEYIAEHGHVINAPSLRPEHYEVFDCAMGERAISPMGHVRMMAAVQPFLSGAISKTVTCRNRPPSKMSSGSTTRAGNWASRRWRSTATPQGRPAAVASGKKAAEAEAPAAQPAPAQPHEHRPVRKRLPRQRPATVTRFSVARAENDMTASRDADDGIGEVFLKLGKGLHAGRVMDAFSMAISVGLQYEKHPLAQLHVAKFTNMWFEPALLIYDPDIRLASSVMDYIFRRLARITCPTTSAPNSASCPRKSSAPPNWPGTTRPAWATTLIPWKFAQSAAVEQPHFPERSGGDSPVSPV